MSDEILDAMRDRIRQKMRAERMRDLEAAANSYHFAKYKGEGIAAAKSRLLEAAWSYGDTPNVLLPREQGNEGYADGAPDASAHDKLCNEIADKLQPFIK